MIEVSDRLDQADICARAIQGAERSASQPQFRAPSFRRGILGGMVLLCLTGGSFPAAAEDPSSSPGERPPTVAGGKRDRVPQPPAPKPPPMAARPQVDSVARIGVEERIEQAFADLPQPQIPPRLRQWAAKVSIEGLNPPTASSGAQNNIAAAAPGADPAQPRRQAVGPAPIVTFPLVREERAKPPRERLGGGYLTALTPSDQDLEALPEMELDSDATGAIPLPGMPAEIPTPTPRPADAPAAALSPEPVAKAPVKPEQAAENPPQSAEVSRPKAPRQEPRPEDQSRPRLPASLLPTRPPAN